MDYTGHFDGGDLLASAAQGAMWAAVGWAARNSAPVAQGDGDTPSEGLGLASRDRGCDDACHHRIEAALDANPEGRSATGKKFYTLTGVTGGEEYGEHSRGHDIARFSKWAVDTIQPIVDELGIKYDVAATKLYIGGDQSFAPALGVIQLKTPVSEAGVSFSSTARSVMHEIGHQLQYSIDGYKHSMATWRSEKRQFGLFATYGVRNTVEWQADYFANSYLPRVVAR